MSNNYIECYLPRICYQSLSCFGIGFGSFGLVNLNFDDPILADLLVEVMGRYGLSRNAILWFHSITVCFTTLYS
jgi:hypothetical protein